MEKNIDLWVKEIMENFPKAHKEKKEIIQLDFGEPFPVTLKIRALEDSGNRLMIAMEWVHTLGHLPRHYYRRALFELIALQRHAIVEFIPYANEEGIECLAARFPASLWTEFFVRKLVTFLFDTLQEAASPLYGKENNEKEVDEDEYEYEENTNNADSKPTNEGWIVI